MAKRHATSATRSPNVTSRQARTAAARQAVERARRQERRQRNLAIGIGAVIATAIAVTIGVVLGISRSGPHTPAAAIPSTPRLTAEGRTTPPPWPAPADVAARVRAAGLPMLGEEGTVEHIHAHLDVIVDGRRVPVPAGIGNDEAAGKISPLHIHDATGVVHIESPVKASFSLGQLFTEWQVSLAADHIGGLHVGDGKLLRAYVNGTPLDGDPAGVVLNAHDEIAIVYGTAEQQLNPPSSYTFTNGE